MAKTNYNTNQPIVVANSGWGEDLPDWLIKEIHSERTIDSMLDSLGKEQEEAVGDTEVVAYLMTASLTSPLDRESTNIYLYLAGKLLPRVKNIEMPEDIKVEQLTSDEERELKHLRGQLFHKRGGKARTPISNLLAQFKQRTKKNDNHKDNSN